MNGIYKRDRWKTLVLEFMPIFMMVISFWCFYFSSKGSEDEMALAGIIFMTLVFLLPLYMVYNNNFSNILLKNNAIELVDFFNFRSKEILLDNIYDMVLTVHSKKVLVLKIFYMKDAEYLSKRVNLDNIQQIEELIKKLRLLAEEKDFNLTEILIKELGIFGEKRIVDKINFNKLGVKFNRKNEVFDNKKNKFNIIGSLLFIAFFIFNFLIFKKTSLIFASVFLLVPAILAILYYKKGYNIMDALFYGFLTLPAIGLMFGGPVILVLEKLF